MDLFPLCYVCFPDSFHSHCWGEQCVVYHTESGDTHLLNKIDLNVLQYIDDTPVSAEDLITEFKAVFGDEAVQYIPSLLSSFTELGLVEIVNNEPAH
jgi:PqqD family protein of HPr-rel-A system